MVDYAQDDRVVLTLDAGGTSFRFSAMCGQRPCVESVVLPSHGDHLERCLGGLVDGFERVATQLPERPVAISFAFPGPADYRKGIIGDLPNLPAFRGGVALGPMLRERFALPVYLNNDGDLFVFGEAIAGLLPEVNALLARAGSPRRYRNLFGITLGTGLGGGLVTDGKVFAGDNSMAAEVWQFRHKLRPHTNAEEGASIRAVQRTYAEFAGRPIDPTLDPKAIFEIARGERTGNPYAALETFRELGEVVGDVLGHALALVDGLAVIGGGMAAAWPLFADAMMIELNGSYTRPDGMRFRRLASVAFDLEDPGQRELFLAGDTRVISVPGESGTVSYDPLPRVGVGRTRLGTSEAVAIGAYAFALAQLDDVRA
ncbi:hypothetical protein AYO41_02045 [Verrucomicrobia bacterium SCGC AG-212-E04]|nr:hypothetical protein AYO41_02045 [Verrucomicrobia bacterium SCGC AG-212-E04]